jgi:hypothetical protein
MTLKFNIFRLTILLLITPLWVCSQKIMQAEGNSEVRQESFMTKDQALEKAEELAKINAIENAFGSYVEQQSDIYIKDGRVNYDLLGGVKVRGEWIKTKSLEINEETRTVAGKYGKEQELWVICSIRGDVRECVSRANLKMFTLNCPVEQCESLTFFHKDSLYLYFKSPVDGFLSVFLDDGENTYRLLPYISMGSLSAVKVSGDKAYIFFSKKKEHQFDSQFMTDRIELTTERNIEYNSVYVVFAENPYVKPFLSEIIKLENNYSLPKSLKTKDFQEWLADCRAEMNDFQAVRIKISIEKR